MNNSLRAYEKKQKQEAQQLPGSTPASSPALKEKERGEKKE